MALYAIGDVQGCNEELGELLDALRFSPDRDQLWFVGDLVNRGPDSLGVMRRVRSLGDGATVVLGNHDLHLIALALGGTRRGKAGDTLADLLDAPDLDALLEWLLERPLMHEDAARGLALVHAGLPPQWDMPTSRRCARELEAALARDPVSLVKNMYADLPDRWDESLIGMKRLRFITNCFTRLRFVDSAGRLRLNIKNSPDHIENSGLIPWFACADARWRGTQIVFGHWSALGFLRNSDAIGLDTGCVWGNRLTSLRLDVPDAPPVSVPCGASRPVAY